MKRKAQKWGKATIMAACAAFMLFAAVFPADAAPAGVKTGKETGVRKRIALVIDDFGNGMSGTKEMMALPVKFTVAVMPFMPTSKADAEEAHRLGHDVIVHMPMEPVRGKKEWLGPGAITTDLDDSEIRRRVEAAIDHIPHAIGMNNHMGSKATADERVMRIVLTVCKERGLIFLDSRTTEHSVIPKLAAEIGVPYAVNNVFLDNSYKPAYIAKQVNVLVRQLQSRSDCVVIGHVGPPGLYTSKVLRSSLPELQQTADFVKLPDIVRGLPAFPDGLRL
ncbi:divergent polysaccharide deacetylase family protein [Paenibacillus cisolokensis]